MGKITSSFVLAAFFLLVIGLGFFSVSSLTENEEQQVFIPSIPNDREIILYDYKYSNHSNIILSTKQEVTCFWRPDDIDDGWKSCEAIFEIDDQNYAKQIISGPEIQLEFANQNIKNLLINFSNTFELYNATYSTIKHEIINITEEVLDEIGNPINKTREIVNITKEVLQFLKRGFMNFTALPDFIDASRSFAIKVSYEVPKYQENSFNFNISSGDFEAFIDPIQSSCGILGVANSIYTLNQSVNSLGTCFTITANNITLNCAGYGITYYTNSSAPLSYGIHNIGANLTTIRNCEIISNASYEWWGIGVYLEHSNNNYIVNNTIGSGIQIDASNFIIENNTMTGTSYNFIEGNNGQIISNNFSKVGGFHIDGNNHIIDKNNIYNVSEMEFFGDNLTIINNNITTRGRAIEIHGGENHIINRNIIIAGFEQTPESIYGYYYGIVLVPSDYNIITNNKITTYAKNSPGIYIQSGSHSIFSNNTINTLGNSSHGVSLNEVMDLPMTNNTFIGMNIIVSHTASFAFYLFDSTNFTLKDSKFNSSNPYGDFKIGNLVNGGELNFTNVTRYNGGKFILNWSPVANNTVNVHWYLDALANYTNGSLATNANITAWNRNNVLQFNVLTGSNGKIPRQELLEYKQNGTGGATIIYYSNYTFNATSPLKVEVFSQSWNMTTNRFLVFTFDGTPPVITVNQPLSKPYNTFPILFNVTLNENGTCNYTLNNGLINLSMQNNGNRNFNASNSSMAEGSYTIKYYCWDMVNNFAQSSRSFSVDTIAPNISFIVPTPENGTFIKDNFVIISVNFTESNIDKFFWNWNGINYTIYPLTFAFNINDNSLSESCFGTSCSSASVSGATFTQGKYEGAYQFDAGTSDVLSTTISSFPAQFTLFAWINQTSKPSYDASILTLESSSYSNLITLAYDTASDKLKCIFAESGPNYKSVLSSQTLPINIWVHVTCKRDGSSLFIYINGNLSNSAPSSGNQQYPGSPYWYIGNNRSNTEAWGGLIDEPRLYGSVLSDINIQQQYLSNLKKYTSTNNYNFITNQTLTEGNYTYFAFVNDTVGNPNQTETRTVTIDTTPPNVALISPADNSISTNTNVTFTCNVTDNIGLKNVSLYLTKLTKVAYFRKNAAPTNVTNDTLLNSSAPNANYGNNQKLKIDNSPNLNSIIKFPNIFGNGNDQIPLGSEIVSAELTFRCTNLGNLINAYRLKEDWVESEATWNNRRAGTPWLNPGAEGLISADMTYYETLDCISDNSWVTLDATRFVQNWSNGELNYGILLNNTGNDGVDLNSSEALPENTRPLLKVIYLYETEWEINQTKSLLGTSNLTQFNLTLEDNSTYKWNCLAYDTAGNSDWGDENWTLKISTPKPIGFYQYPIISFYNETTEIILFEANRAVNGTVEYWPESNPSNIQIKNLNDISTVHEFNITGLIKGTRYGYRINITNTTEDEFYFDSFNSSFKTPDYSVTSFKFVVVGDMRAQSGTGTGIQADVFSNITARILDINPDLVINVGDVVDTDDKATDEEDYSLAKSAWKEYTDIVWNLTDHIPNFISIGNHEEPDVPQALRRYREVVIHPLNGNGSTSANCYQNNCYDETTYWLQYGNSLFVSLNSEEADHQSEIKGSQLDWLNKTLNMSGFVNKFVFLHKPIKGEKVISNDVELDQMFDYYNVTAVFAGDKHYYCRNNTATLYIITGGGGADLVSADNCKAADNNNAKVKAFHFVNITLVGDTIYGNAINMSNGAVLDTFNWTTPS